MKKLLPILVFSLLTMLMAGPVFLHMNDFFHTGVSRYPPGSDCLFDVWQFWWVKKVIAEGRALFSTDFLFYPRGARLEFSLTMLLWDVISIPLQSFFSLPTIHNLFFIVATILSGVGAFCLCYYVTQSRTAAYFAGMVYAFNPFRFAHIDHLEVFSTFWIPIAWLLGLKLFDQKRLRDSLLLGLVLSLACYTELITSTLMLLMFPIAVAYFVFIAKRWSLSDLKLLVPCLSVIFICVSPYGYVLLKDYFAGRAHVSLPLQSSISQSADLLSFFVPSYTHPIVGKWTESFYDTVGTFNGIKVSAASEVVAYVGLSVLALSVWAIRKGLSRRLKFIFMASIVFMVLSLGPALKCFGLVKIPASFLHLDVLARALLPGLDPLALDLLSKYAGIPLPFLSFHFLPILNGIQSSTRLFVFAILGLSLIAGWGYSQRSVKWSKAIAIIAPLFLLFEYLSWKVPHETVKIPSYYSMLRAESGDYAVLDIPLTAENPQSDPRYELTRRNPFYNLFSGLSTYYQTVHEKRIMGGLLGRWPKDMGDYAYADPDFARLLERPVRLTKLRPDSNVLAEHKIKYIVAHKDFLRDDELFEVRRFADIWRLPRIFEDDSILVLGSRRPLK